MWDQETRQQYCTGTQKQHTRQTYKTNIQTKHKDKIHTTHTLIFRVLNFKIFLGF